MPAEESFTRIGSAPEGLSTAAATIGFRLPALYSMRMSRASGLPWNHAVPYSSMYMSPFGANSISIGALKFVVGMKRSMDTRLPVVSIVTAMIQ